VPTGKTRLSETGSALESPNNKAAAGKKRRSNECLGGERYDQICHLIGSRIGEPPRFGAGRGRNEKKIREVETKKN